MRDREVVLLKAVLVHQEPAGEPPFDGQIGVGVGGAPDLHAETLNVAAKQIAQGRACIERRTEIRS